MTWVKVYHWERETFVWHWSVNIRPEYRQALTDKLSRRFGLGPMPTYLDTRGGAFACSRGGWSRFIRLPRASLPCPLGMICHEIAHFVNVQTFGGQVQSHTGTFRKALIKVLVEARPMLPAIFSEIRQEQTKLAEVHRKIRESVRKAAVRAAEAERRRQSPEYRLERAAQRARRLRTRIKRLQTALKRAERSQRALERACERHKAASAPLAAPGGALGSPEGTRIG